MQIDAVFAGLRLESPEALRKTPGSPAQRLLRVDAHAACQGDDRKQQIADRILGIESARGPVLTALSLARHRSGDVRNPAQRVLHSVERHRRRRCLVESDASRTFLHPLGMRQRRERGRDSVEQ